MWRQLTWSHYKTVLPIKDENERNYYVNLSIEQSLSVRSLKEKIKNNSFNRLVDKPKKVELINKINDFSIRSNIKSPIILKLNKGEIITNEKELQIKIISEFQSFFSQLGNGFSLIGNEYKIVNNGKIYFIDILLFNYKFNQFIVVELKFRELKQIDKGEIELYMKLVDEQVKEPFHNKSIGIIISKEQDEFIATYVGQDNIIPITYELKF